MQPKQLTHHAQEIWKNFDKWKMLLMSADCRASQCVTHSHFCKNGQWPSVMHFLSCLFSLCVSHWIHHWIATPLRYIPNFHFDFHLLPSWIQASRRMISTGTQWIFPHSDTTDWCPHLLSTMPSSTGPFLICQIIAIVLILNIFLPVDSMMSRSSFSWDVINMTLFITTSSFRSDCTLRLIAKSSCLFVTKCHFWMQVEKSVTREVLFNA